MGGMGELLAFLLTKGWVVYGPAATFIVLLTLTPFGNVWQSDADRKRVIGNLAQGRARMRYERIMRRVLDWIDLRLSRDELDRQLSTRRIAFSSDLIGLTMVLAVAYPILSIVIQWICGFPMTLGTVELAEAGTGLQRGFAGVWLLTFAAILAGVVLSV